MIEYENLAKTNFIFNEKFQTDFSKFLENGWYILGDQVKNFESEFANYLNAENCIGVASGLDALFLSLLSLNLEKNDEILVPSNTYIATILAIIHAGLKPILIEPNIETYNIDPNLILDKINKKTKAILVVHLYGKSCDMEPIVKIATEKNLYVLEDCAQAHGAMYKGKKIGTFGIGCFSFYPTKNLGALGDGGSVVTNNIQIANNIRILRNYGSKEKYKNSKIGYNSRLDELQAYFLSTKLKVLDELILHKRKLAQMYFDYLSNNFIKPKIQTDFFDVFHIFNIRTNKRDELRKFLLQNDIKTEVHYPIPPHRQDALKGYFTETFPISEEIHRTTLSLPIAFFHTENEIFKVIEVLNSWRGD